MYIIYVDTCMYVDICICICICQNAAQNAGWGFDVIPQGSGFHVISVYYICTYLYNMHICMYMQPQVATQKVCWLFDVPSGFRGISYMYICI